jgi:hypothetical protein
MCADVIMTCIVDDGSSLPYTESSPLYIRS